MRNEIVRGMPAKEYHADPCDTPSLSQSIATILIQHSPAHAYLAHPRLGAQAEERSEGQELGTLMHALLLDRGNHEELEPVMVKYEGAIVENYRTKIAQQERDRIIASGKVPIICHKFEEARAYSDKVATRLRDKGCNMWGESAEHEVSMFWESNGVQCRGRVDAMVMREADKAIDLWDLKCISDASEDEIRRIMVRCDYALQAEAYKEAIGQLVPGYAVRFHFAFYEPKEPYATRIVTMSESMAEYGFKRWVRARDKWGECLASGKWPDYANAVIDCPAWAMAAEGVGT